MICMPLSCPSFLWQEGLGQIGLEVVTMQFTKGSGVWISHKIFNLEPIPNILFHYSDLAQNHQRQKRTLETASHAIEHLTLLPFLPTHTPLSPTLHTHSMTYTMIYYLSWSARTEYIFRI